MYGWIGVWCFGVWCMVFGVWCMYGWMDRVGIGIGIGIGIGLGIDRWFRLGLRMELPPIPFPLSELRVCESVLKYSSTVLLQYIPTQSVDTIALKRLTKIKIFLCSNCCACSFLLLLFRWR